MRKEKLAQILPILCVVTGNVIWGFSFLFTKVAISRTDPNVMLGHRFTLAVLIMAGMLLTGREKFLEERYFFTISATLKVMACSNSRRSRPVILRIFSRR